ncbi:hypothetical protein E4U12_000593 [Claviceps purpurea]|nr:hypothetical protein E4U12_000593 [Claviceps purpurea]KAG6149832.1 hypothetical protein E4U11_008573 [Claviceps purpurea]
MTHESTLEGFAHRLALDGPRPLAPSWMIAWSFVKLLSVSVLGSFAPDDFAVVKPKSVYLSLSPDCVDLSDVQAPDVPSPLALRQSFKLRYFTMNLQPEPTPVPVTGPLNWTTYCGYRSSPHNDG